MPHHRHRQTVQSCSRGDANVNIGATSQARKYNWTSAFSIPPESTTRTANQSIQPFLHSSWYKVPIVYNECPFPKNCPFPWRIWTPSNTRFLGPHSSPQPKRHLLQFSRFCTDDCRVSVYFTMGHPFTPQNCPSHRGSEPPTNTWFHGPTGVLNPNSISVASAVERNKTL